MSPDREHIAVLGAGITGLTAAWELAQAGRAVTVYEAERVPGGLMASFPFANTELDRVYHHVFLDDAAVLALLDALGLGGEMLWGVAPSGYFHGGRVYPLGSAWDLLRFAPLSLWERVRFGLSVLRARRVAEWEWLDDLTAREWLQQLCGRRAYEVLWEPLLRAKFGEAYGRVSAAWMWYKLRQRSSSRRGRASRETLGYLRGSFGRLATALVEAIEHHGGRVRLATPVERLERAGGGFALTTAGGQATCDRVLVTVAPPLFLEIAPGLPADYRQRLSAIHYTANLCLVLALDHPLTDIYWLNISDGRFPFGGIIEHTNLVPPRHYGGRHVVYLTRYLDRQSPALHLSADELLDRYEPFLREVQPAFQRAWVQEAHVFRAPYAAPLCTRGYRHRVPPLATPVPGLFLATMSQIYPEDRGINCGVELGQRVARQMLASAAEAGEVPQEARP